jgi:hypothetical protein
MKGKRNTLDLPERLGRHRIKFPEIQPENTRCLRLPYDTASKEAERIKIYSFEADFMYSAVSNLMPGPMLELRCAETR